MNNYYTIKLQISFAEAVQKITQNLQQQGFGIITTIDLQETLKKKLSIDFRKYTILGACNPEFAYKAVTLESHSGLLLPCNIVVQEHENKEVEVSAMNYFELFEKSNATAQLTEIVRQANNRLRAAIDQLHSETAPGNHVDALPTNDEKEADSIVPFPG